MDQPSSVGAPSPWHAGELAIQQSIGVVERMDQPGRLFVRDFMPEQHRSFFPLLHFVVLGSVDARGDPWATVRAGRAGFLRSPDAQTLHVGVARDAADPADAGMGDGDAIGLLGIDPMTRRRNRLNGTVRRAPDGAGRGFDIAVGQSFGNCPQYIQSRSLRFVRDPGVPGGASAVEQPGLDARARAMVAAADTFYVASYITRDDGTRQVDVSHRGGKPGFVRVGEDGVLTVPDFSGNKFFMTLGNLLVNPRAGLLFVDPATGDMLQMTGEARVILEGPEIAAFEGAERLWTFTPRRVLHRPDALPLRWRMAPDGWSPSLAMTGSWPEAAQRLAAATRAGQWRPFRVARTVDESAGVRSLHLEPADGLAALPSRPGQHLPVRLTLADGTRLVRSYTLSSAPSDGHYRISVKRQGQASTQLHALAPGALVEARAPAGHFTLDAAVRRPAVLLAAGIGITPLLAMLRHTVQEGRRTRYLRPTWLFQSARTLAERPFDAEIAALVEAAQGAVRWVRVLSQPGEAEPGRDFEHAGRIDMALLQATLPFGDHDFYLCGPAAFMQATYDGLRALNVPDDRIHAEAFGPSALRRAGADAVKAEPLPPPATEPVRLVFTASGREARWTPGAGSLLDVAEAQGLSPAFGCRGGSCGSCATRVQHGAVTYAERPPFTAAPGEALLCCAVPAQGQGEVHLAV
ncbi:2Fe-2S iron-sulfur cluster-binding protein [Pseudorhodoferax sp.]|uniref:2Fe-2S iron-sulfur cluster-binding protein n=1 Tax=Pseudorhodoferax sp. TaxID=1993553 RepID=UPI002DD61FD1|nr:pyridoxamine 5'-phosphate oxidase family protein [Pseudorhodoferax sp.]